MSPSLSFVVPSEETDIPPLQYLHRLARTQLMSNRRDHWLTSSSSPRRRSRPSFSTVSSSSSTTTTTTSARNFFVCCCILFSHLSIFGETFTFDSSVRVSSLTSSARLRSRFFTTRGKISSLILARLHDDDDQSLDGTIMSEEDPSSLVKGRVRGDKDIQLLAAAATTTTAASQIACQPRRSFLSKLFTATAVSACGVGAFVGTPPPSLAASSSPANSANNPMSSTASSMDAGGSYVKVSRKAGGLAQKIRGSVCLTMDELQRDLMQERWDLLTAYPSQLRSYVPVLTTYTDSAFSTDLPSDYGLRVALRYEVGRFFASVERLKRAINKQALDEAYTAYADMSLHLDRYLRVGGLYTYYDNTIDNEPLFKDYNDALVYADPIKDPAEVRDLIVLCKGPDKGRTGIVIGMYPSDGSYSPSGSGSKRKIGAAGGSATSAAVAASNVSNCVVKLERYRGMREIRVVPRNWAAKRLGEQDPDDVFLIPRSQQQQQQNQQHHSKKATAAANSRDALSS